MQVVIRHAVWAMSLEGLNVIVGKFTMSLLGFHSPCHGDTSLMLGVGDCSSNAKALAQSRMDAVPLFARIEIKSREACRHKVKGVDIGLQSHVDDRTDASIPIRSSPSRPNILECKGLIKGLCKFVLRSLLRQLLL